ncbi:Uma2 family endonuclease [Gemmata sp. JC717]|uniref:Uma2 family endonuclease n=1 Tax=Gemmata algarum TaxID=2975278 RepID=UPI0021BA87B4|nr:Uma2 family endonuclease [Gemmata algarum]MDY3552585.1 Uma2 family endonuclease [Gemmata algarum]
MSVTATKRLLTAEEFARLPDPPDGSKQELVRGEVVTVMAAPSFRHGLVQLNVALALKTFAKASNLGRVTAESGLVTEHAPDTVRGPDVAFWSFERLPAERTPDVYPDVAADLCVEVKSPSNTPARTTKKIGEYFACGVRLVWVVDPEERTVTVYTKPGDGRVLWDNATLDGGDVLPGFTCPVADFFQ